MRVFNLVLITILALSVSGCSWLGLSGDDAPEGNDPKVMEDGNAPKENVFNPIPGRPANVEGSPSNEARDPNNIIPGGNLNPNAGNPDRPAETVKRDMGYELLQYLNSIAINDSTPPWYNLSASWLSKTVEDINMHYKRMLPPLDPDR